MRPPGSNDGGPLWTPDVAQEGSADSVQRVVHAKDGDQYEGHGERAEHGRDNGLPSGQKHGRSASRLVAQALTRTDVAITRLREEAESVLTLLAQGAFSNVSIGRHRKRLDRIRGQLDDHHQLRNDQGRILWEAQIGLTNLDESLLTLAGERLGQVSSLRGLLDLIAMLGGGEGPRRLVVRRADRLAAMNYALGTNPTTIFLDAPFIAAGQTTPEPIEGSVGRTLAGQHALSVGALS